jgi:hypothetical protein
MPSPCKTTFSDFVRALKKSTTLNGRQLGMLTGLIVPAVTSSGPADPMPTPSNSPLVESITSFVAASKTDSKSRAEPVEISRRARMLKVVSIVATVAFVPPISTASAYCIENYFTAKVTETVEVTVFSMLEVS